MKLAYKVQRLTRKLVLERKLTDPEIAAAVRKRHKMVPETWEGYVTWLRAYLHASGFETEVRR